MSDPDFKFVFWLAFAGLLTVILSLAALLETQRRRSIHSVRLSRANGTGPSRTANLREGRGSSLAHLRMRLRRMVVQMGQRLSVVMGGEANDAAADLASAGYRSRDALLI